MSVTWKDFKAMVERNIHDAKGDAGRVLVLAGEYPGAAVLAAQAALRSGVDSVHVLAPRSVAPSLAAANPDLVITALPASGARNARMIKERAERADVLLVGPGLGVSEEHAALLRELATGPTRLVLDADATKQAPLAALHGALILANAREYELLGAPAPGANVLVVKGPTDRILAGEEQVEISGGHPRATVNGTGDVLAGLAAGLFAQTHDAVLAAKAASFLLKRAAEAIGGSLHFGWTASELVAQLPKTLHEYRVVRVTRHEPTAMKQAKKHGRWAWRNASAPEKRNQ